MIEYIDAENETPCCECGGVVHEFSVDNDVWNAVMRPDGEHDQEFVCLRCFARKAATWISEHMLAVQVAKAATAARKADLAYSKNTAGQNGWRKWREAQNRFRRLCDQLIEVKEALDG